VVKEENFSKVSPWVENSEELNLVFNALATSCPQLRVMALSTANRAHLISEQTVLTIAQSLPKLEYLDLRTASGIHDSSMEKIAERCTSLRTLLLGHCRTLT